MRNSVPWRLLCLAIAFGFSLGCADSQSFTSHTVITNGLPSGPPEKPYCSLLPSKTNFGGGATIAISGSAGYYYRKNGLGESGTLSTTTRPIRYAEVVVYDGGNRVVQCAETDDKGNFSFAMPADNGAYRVAVASRAFNSHIQASVLNKPEANTPYEVSITLVSDASKQLPQIVAQADQKLDPSLAAGAFNILDDIYQANLWLNTQTANCADPTSPNFVAGSCVPFTVAPKVMAYWSAGFNPGSYYADSSGQSTPISFYIPGDRILMILGGLNGDVNSSDTDQFDNSVIIHEYGHFIEDVFAKTNSPGGSHDGNSIIDPRLAWGEGWANFFQAAVTGIPNYRDTMGTSDGSFGVFFDEDLTTQKSSQTNSEVSDIPLTFDEGIYHEFSVSRALWAIIAPHAVTHTNSQEANLNGGAHVPFAELWHLFVDPTNGFRSQSFHFRNMGLWLNNQSHLNREDLAVIRADEMQDNKQSQYAIPIKNGGCTHTNNITATKGTFDNGSFATSNLARANHFYHLSHPGGPTDIAIAWNSAGAATDLDLYLYREVYSYGDTTTMAGSNNKVGLCANGCNKDMNVGNLPAGDYLINVMVYTHDSVGSKTTYDLTLNGGLLCADL